MADTKGVERAQWGNQVEFIMTMVSYAVGLGNVWRFPYLCYSNGGGAFLIPYVIMLAVIGMPIFFMETALGQYAGLGPTQAFRISPLFRGIGWATVTISVMITIYYNVLVAYMLYYLAFSMTKHLPWSTCADGNGTWAEAYCKDIGPMGNTTVNLTKQCENGTLVKYRTPSEDYYYNHVSEISKGMEYAESIPPHLAIALLVAWIIVALVLIKGVQSLGKFVYVTAIFPYIMLTILLINNCLQDGAIDGIIFYIKPDWKRLLDYKVWADAASQIFFSLSACYGGLVAMSSYNRFNNNLHRDTIMITLINCGTSFYAGFAIFSALGTMAYAKNVSVGEVATTGPELAFVTYPQALAQMPVAPLWSILFFVMMCLLGFGSEFSTCETVITVMMDEWPALRKTVLRSIVFRIAMFTTGFILGLPLITQGGLYLLTIVDDNAGGLPLLVVGMCEMIAISWIYGTKKFSANIEEMIGFKPNIYWQITWTCISPIILIIIVILKLVGMIQRPTVYTGYIFGPDCPYRYPSWGYALAWMIVITPVIPIVVGFVYQLYKEKRHHTSFIKALIASREPDAGWGSQANRNKTMEDDVDTTEKEKDPETPEKATKKEMDMPSTDMEKKKRRRRRELKDKNGTGNPAYEMDKY